MTNEEQIAGAKQAIEEAKQQLLTTFQFVPEDKLDWTPSPSARTALQIVAHCGVSNQAFATILRGEEVQLPASPKEAAAIIRAGGRDIRSRAEAVKLVEDSTAEVLRALDSVSEERLQTVPKGPFPPLPFAVWMQVPSMHMGGHVHQINYLQTVWGDIEDHA